MPRGKRDPVPLPHAELPSANGEGLRGGGGDGRRSASEEEGLARDDLTKSMSSSSVSSYHSALCSEGTETFKDCLEFLDEETPPRDGGAEGAVPGRWAPTGTHSAPPPTGPLARPRKAQLSSAAKNSPAPGQGGRMGPHSSQQPAKATTGTAAELARARPPVGMLARAPSDSDEADGEVRALTARAFRSLSGPHGTRLDMCSSHTSSSLSNSLSEDGGRPQQWPAAGVELLHGRAGWPFPTRMDGELLGLMGKEQFECVDVELESGEARKGHGKKRTVPKRQILLKRKERKETGFGPRGDGVAPQPLPPARKEPPSKGRAVGEDFRLNYKQFMKTASLDADTGKTRAASCLVKNVLAKKMQYEQRIKMEQKGLRGSSTSSGPSSMGTDLLGDGLEGKSSSLSRSDCSFSAEDLRGGEMPVAAVAVGDVTTTRPTKGVVLSEATKESVCKLKKTFNELNERMKYQEVLEGNRLPSAAEEPVSARIRYQQARALFEAHPEVGKTLDVAPRFGRAPKPWPSLRQRAIRPSYSQALPLEAESPVLPAVPPCRLFTSRAQEVRLVPQSQQEEKPPAVPPPIPACGSPPAAPHEVEDKGKGRIPQPRDVRKLVKSSYSLCFRASSVSHSTTVGSGEPLSAAPLVIHCTSVRRRDAACEQGDGEELAATGPEPAPAHAEGPRKLTGSQPSPSRSSPVHITKVQATRRGAAAVEEPVASPPRRERSELRVPPRVPAAEGVPHVESHLHILVGRRSPAAAREDPPAQSSATLRTEKTVLLPPPPPSPTEGKDGHGHGGTGGVHATERPESAVQQRGDSGQPHARDLAGSRVHMQPEEPTERRAPKPPTSEWASAGSSGSAGSTGPTTLVQAREAGEGASGQLLGRREPWEHLSKWPAASEPYLAASPPENSNYLAIPVKAPKSSPMPKLPSIPTPDTTSLGTPMVPKLVSASSGTPSVPNLASASFGAHIVPNPASRSFGTSSVPSMTSSSSGYPSASGLASTSFGAPLVSSTTTKPLGAPLIPYPASASFGNPLVPNLSGAPFGTALAPNPSSASFGTPLAPNPSSASFGTPMVPNTANISFGIPLVSNPSSASFGTPLAPNPSSAPFGTPMVPNTANISFGIPLVSNPSSSSFGTPLAPNPSSASFGTPSVPKLANSSLGIPLVSNQVSSSFGSPLISNPVPASLGHPSISNVASSSFGSPLAPSLDSAPPGTGVAPLAGGGAPWSKPSSEPPQPRPTEGLAAAEHPVPLPPAQPRLEDIPHFLRRTDGASPGSKSAPSPTKPFAPHLPGHRRVLVDPDSGKYYYMEQPRQPQLKMLYDPETGQYLEVLIPPVASHTGLYQAPFNPLVMTPGVYAPPYVPYGGFTGLPAPAAPSPVHPDLPAAENPGFSSTFSPMPKSEGPPAAGGAADCGYLESLYYIPTGMRASPGPSHPPARTSPEKGLQLQM